MQRSNSSAALRTRLSLVAALLLVGACPDPEPEPEPCAGDGDPVLALANRDGEAPLVDGDDVEVFPPPQGGVFTEFDVTIEDMAASELDALWVTIESDGSGDTLATVRFFGEGLPLQCTEEEVLVVDNLPVGFDSSVTLAGLDGMPVVITATAETSEGNFVSRYDATLRSTDY
ncbi:MAG: hypothetical protein AAF799_23085 [Myxococcota bacterium]